MRARPPLLSMLIALTILGSTPALAAPVLPAASAPSSGCGPYTVAFYEYSALYHRDEQGRWTGLDKELVDELARRSGCRFQSRTESRVRIWAQLASGQLDITVSALPTPERELLVEFVPYVESRQYIVMRDELARTLTTPAAFLADRSRRLLVVRGYAFTPTLERFVAQLRVEGRVVEAPDQPSALRIFKAGRADALLLGVNSLAMARRKDPDFARFTPQLYAPQEISVGALAMSRQRVRLEDRNLLRRTLTEMERDGSLAALKRRHLGDLGSLAPPGP